jgi:hypothetical protein
MRLNWQGTFFDGQTARRHRVEVNLTPTEIRMTREDGQVLLWPFEEITQTQGYYKGEQVRIERGREPAQALVIPEVDFLQALRRIAPEHSGRFHDPAFRKRRFLWITVGTFGAVAAAAVVYLWGARP